MVPGLSFHVLAHERFENILLHTPVTRCFERVLLVPIEAVSAGQVADWAMGLDHDVKGKRDNHRDILSTMYSGLLILIMI